MSNDQDYYDDEMSVYDDDEVSVFSNGATSSVEDMTSDQKAELDINNVGNEVPEILSGISVLSGGIRTMPNLSQVTHDKRPRRDSIESNFGTPEIQVTPLDEFMTKGGDSRPERRNHNKPLTPTSCNYDLRCELCGKSYKIDVP